MSAEQKVVRARIEVKVYRAEDGLRWRIRSSARGKRIIADSGQGYSKKADVFRGLLLVTGGTYRCLYWHRFPDGVYEQGEIQRRGSGGAMESIFVQYLSGRAPR